jgi:carbon monoxide dehydrogenase subunit G
MLSPMTIASTKSIINGPASKVWETLRNFDGVERYLPVVKSSIVKGSSEGAERTCTVQMSHDQAPMLFEEKLVKVDEANRSLSYVIVDSSMPIDDYVGTIKVTDLGENKCEVEWSSKFNAKGILEKESTSMIEGIAAMGLDGLRKLHER